MEVIVSKGSQQRPGTGYAEGWDRIFGKKDPLQELVELTESMGLCDSDFQKVNDVDLLVTMECSEVERVCKNCKKWNEANQQTGRGGCDDHEIRSYREPHEGPIWLTPPADFGCNRFEAKQREEGGGS